MIVRQKYLDKLIAFQDTDLVKVVTGIRRCGKSTLLDMMRDYLAAQGVPENRLLTFKMESMELASIAGYRELYNLVVSRIPICSSMSCKTSKDGKRRSTRCA